MAQGRFCRQRRRSPVDSCNARVQADAASAHADGQWWEQWKRVPDEQRERSREMGPCGLDRFVRH